jgi:hypothetical protein
MYVQTLKRQALNNQFAGVATRHSCKTLKVLREECQVYPQEKQEEVSLSMVFRILTTSRHRHSCFDHLPSTTATAFERH